MTGAPDTDLIEKFTTLFFEYGPFFLALFLPVFILGKARDWYNEANVRQSPVASKEELATYRLYFLGSIVCSVLVVFISLCAWWLLNINRENVFKFAVVDLAPNENVDSVGYYFREIQSSTPSGNFVHTRYFVVTQNSAFLEGQKFELRYYYPIASSNTKENTNSVPLAGTSDPQVLTVEYHRSAAVPTYRLNRNHGQVSLVQSDDGTLDAMNVAVPHEPVHLARALDGDRFRKRELMR